MATTYVKEGHEDLAKASLKYPFRILMYCGSGYSFGEYFKPIVESLVGDYDIKFLQADYYLTEPTIKSLEELLHWEKFSYQIVHIMRRNESSFKFHRGIRQMINILRKETFNMLILNTDSNLIDRYLINLARSKRIKVVIIHGNVMHMEVLRRYRKNIGIADNKPLPHELKGKIVKFQSSKDKIGFIFSYIFKRIVSFPKKINLSWQKFINNYLWPYIFFRTIFTENKYDKFHFTSGRADSAICYDPMDTEALKNVVISVKNVYLARHPAAYYSTKLPEPASRKLLVLLTSYLVELPEEQFRFWVETIRRVSEKKNLDEIHLRFHPRTDKRLTWPKKLIDAISNLGPKVEIVDSNKLPLAESVVNYVGVIGTVSGSLRTARAACSGFVIGLLKTGGDSLSLLDEDWVLGSSEGINWINNAGEIQDKHFMPLSSIDKDRPTVAEIIRNMCRELEKPSRI